MSVWTINDVPLANLGVENLVINIQNMDDDYVEVRLKSKLPPVWTGWESSNSMIQLKRDGALYFSGKIDAKSLSLAPLRYEKSIFIYGPWHFMAKTPYLFSYPYNNGNKTTTHSIFSGSAKTALGLVLGKAIEAGLISAYYVDIDDFTLPKQNNYDLTIAEAIRFILSYVPNSACPFDYQHATPTMWILKRSSSNLLTWTCHPYQCASIDLTPRPDLKLDGVELHYEVAETVKVRTWKHVVGQPQYDKIEYSANNFTHLGTDRAGTTTGNVLRKTIVLDGHRDVLYLNWHVGNQSVDLADILWNTTNPTWAWINYFMSVNSKRHPGERISASGAPTSQEIAYSFSGVSAMYDALWPNSKATAEKWVAMMRVWDPAYTGGHVYDNIVLRSFPDEIMYSAEYPEGLQVLKAEISWKWTDPEAGSGTSTGEQYFFWRRDGMPQSPSGTRTIISGTWETPPTGIAQKVLAANSTIPVVGSFSVQIHNSPYPLLGHSGQSRLVTINGLASGLLIQRMSLDIKTNVATFSVGAPVHLGPQDYITLQRAGKTSS